MTALGHFRPGRGQLPSMPCRRARSHYCSTTCAGCCTGRATHFPDDFDLRVGSRATVTFDKGQPPTIWLADHRERLRTHRQPFIAAQRSLKVLIDKDVFVGSAPGYYSPSPLWLFEVIQRPLKLALDRRDFGKGR